MSNIITNIPFITSEEVAVSLHTDIPRHSSEEVLHASGIEVNSYEELYAQAIAPSTIYNYHRVPFYHIFRLTGTNNAHFIENKKIILNNDCLLIINRDISHKYSKRRCKGNMALFTNSFLARTPEKADFLNNCTLFQSNYVIIPMQSEEFITAIDTYFLLMKGLHPECELSTADTGVLRNLLYILLMIIERQYRLRNTRFVISINNKDYMQQFKTLLDMHYQTQKQINFYAKKLRMPEKKLSQIVYAAYGFSAKTYINEKILLEAILLLKNTTLNQGEIAHNLGLDFTYFIKFFRKHTGLTPAKYRQRENSKLNLS
ncbi:MAG: helix-turn-helix domain-containing protein [Prevotellaceae bacterium]|jgi:AraC-like DNA-binding protein|nr:helix-turn-helix domain-containing protein [Prevotellaceae bacterium]